MCELVYKMTKYIGETCGQNNKKLQYCIALAAFAQFHFVDIHPFTDGNGRMCRFISKRVLDWMLPLPVPMFISRDKYLEALENARIGPALNAPSKLYDLILDQCIDQYEKILNDYKNVSFKDLIVATSEKDLEYQLRYKPYAKMSSKLIESFKILKDEETFDEIIDGIIVRIKKYPEICIDDI